MAHLDSSEYDDDPARARARPPGGYRPAWDAATYGHPDDTRYPTPSHYSARGGAVTGTHRYGDGMSPHPLYAGEDYPPGGGARPEPAGGGYPGAPDRPPPSAAPYPVEAYPVEAYPAEAYPAEVPPHRGHRDRGSQAPRDARRGRAGRNLPLAIGVGLLLGAAVLSSLFVWRPAFLALAVVAVGVGSWELVRAVRLCGARPPSVPLIVGGAMMIGLAWWGRTDGLVFGLVVTVLAVMVWRLAEGPDGYGRDIGAATLIAVYLPFLAGFAALLASAPDGDLRVVAMLAGVVLSDTGGFVAGVLLGRHPMAPSVSPKKSWEGLAGSLLATGVGGGLLLFFMFGVPVWLGALFGLAISAASILGDLGESLIKRDLQVKDMGRLLPGHGGVMDRLDSIVFAAPTAYALLVLLAPPG